MASDKSSSSQEDSQELDKEVPPVSTGLSQEAESLSLSETCPFDEEQQKIIDEHIKYHADMITYLSVRKTGAEKSKPKKPKSSLAFLESPEKAKTVMTVAELDDFLREKLIQDDETNVTLTEEDVNKFNKCKTVDDMIPFMKQSWKVVKFEKRKTQHHSLILGYQLGKARTVFKSKPKKQSWSSFIKEKCHIHDSYARRLILLSSSFYYFPKFHKLGISFEALLNKRHQIEKCMAENEDFRKFWQS